MTRIPHSRRGGIVPTVVICLLLIGMFLLIQSMGLLAIGSVAKAHADFRATTEDSRRYADIVRESVLAVRGYAYETSSATLTDEIHARLAALNSGLDVTDPRCAVLDTDMTGLLPALGMFPALNYPALGPVPANFNALASPEVVRLAGPRVAVSTAVAIDFHRTHVVLERANVWSARVTTQLVQAPMSRHPVVSYVFPSDVLRTDGGLSSYRSSLPLGSPLPGGMIPQVDSASVPDLRSDTSLPLYYRERTVLAAAYQFVFSGNYLQQLIEAAGYTHCGDLDAGPPALASPNVPVVNPAIAGVTEQTAGQEFTLDVGATGVGVREVSGQMISATKQLVCLFTRSLTSKVVHLTDSGASNGALMVVLVGGADPAAQPLVVEVDSDLVRPVVILGYNVRIASIGTRLVNGAVMIDPRSSIDTTAGRLNLAHFSYYALSATTANSVVVNQTMPQDAEQLVPRATYVSTGVSQP